VRKESQRGRERKRRVRKGERRERQRKIVFSQKIGFEWQ
jgi:hypothetical protein